MNRKLTQIIIAASYVTLAGCTKGGLLVSATDCPAGQVRSGNGRMCISETAKLGATACVDVNLAKVVAGESVTMCDGSTGVGTLNVPVACTEDGQESCVNETGFKAVKTANLSADKIAKGTTIAGVTGTKREIKQCRNAADLAVYDSTYAPSNLYFQRAAANMNSGTTDTINLGSTHGLSTNSPVRLTTSGTLPPELTVGTTYYVIVASTTTIQLASVPNGTFINFSGDGTGNHTFYDVGDGTASYFDTTDDRNNSLAYSPGSGPWGASYVCDATNFTNVSTEVIPTGSIPTNGTDAFTEVWRDELTGLLLTNILFDGVGASTWAHVVQMCEGLNGSSAGTGWRLPTQKELMQLHIDGISKVALAGGTTNTVFWSSSAVSTNTNYAWYVHLSFGSTSTNNRFTTGYAALCVR